PFKSMPAIKLVTKAKGTISKTLGMEIFVFCGKIGSLMRIKNKGMEANIIKLALKINTVLLGKSKDISKIPKPDDE
ncbi:hypothetical protein, partial [Campylobacter fetus]|uniref:hypothetical protein n=1 Tax=Campylobacter fetus TaxID=196 RepID=UPI001CA76BBD